MARQYQVMQCDDQMLDLQILAPIGTCRSSPDMTYYLKQKVPRSLGQLGRLVLRPCIVFVCLNTYYPVLMLQVQNP